MTKRGALYLLVAAIAFLIGALIWRGAGDLRQDGRAGRLDPNRAAESSEGRAGSIGADRFLTDGPSETADLSGAPVGAHPLGEFEDVKRIVVGEAPELLIEGRVVSEADGSPVAGAELAVSEPAPDGLPLLLPTGQEMKFRTDALGRFRLYLKRKQSFTLSAEADGFRRRTLSNIEPVSRSGLIVSMTPFLKVEGIVVDALDRGVAEAEVSIKRSIREGFYRSVDSTRTDERGRFALNRVAEPGDYWIAAAHAEHLPAEPAEVTLERGDNSLKLILESASADEAASIWGRVLDMDDFPISGAEVSILETVRGNFSMRLATTRSGPDGFYRFPAVRLGSYSLNCGAKGFATSDPRRFASLTIDQAGFEYRQDFVLSPEARLSGAVSDEEGAPVAGAAVLAHPEGSPGMGVFTQEDGRFLLKSLAPGDYTVEVRHSDYRTLTLQAKVPREGDLQIQLRQGFGLYGTAANLGGGPLESFTLHLTDASRTQPWKRARVNAPDGRFRMLGIAPGAYSLTLQLPDGRTYSGPLQIGEDLWATLRVDLSRQEGGPLSMQTSRAPAGLQ
jgi:hypothetical protein